MRRYISSKAKKKKNHYLKLNYSAWWIHYSVVLKYMSAPYKSYYFVGQMSLLFAFKEYLNLYWPWLILKEFASSVSNFGTKWLMINWKPFPTLSRPRSRYYCGWAERPTVLDRLSTARALHMWGPSCPSCGNADKSGRNESAQMGSWMKRWTYHECMDRWEICDVLK